FETAETVKASPISLKYSWQGNSYASFYRIKAVEPSGAVVYSNMIDLAGKGRGYIVVYPNPVFSREVFISATKPLTGNTSFLIINAVGQPVASGVLQPVTSAIRLQLPALSPGIYLLKIVNKDETFLQKISIL